MAKVSKALVDKELRDKVFDLLLNEDSGVVLTKINDRQYGILLTDANGEQRYVRIGAIVAELRDDMTAEELMQAEINAFQEKVMAKQEKAKAKAEKIAKDKERRKAEAEAKTKEKEM